MVFVNRFLSEKIKVLSVISVIAVLYLHAKFAESSQWIIVDLIQNLINDLCRFAVPTFFIISGYLFFKDVGTVDTIQKIIKRVKTILLPYFLWCTVFILVIAFCTLFADSNTQYFELLEKRRYLAFVSYVYIDPPAAFHLWYLRDLFILFCLSPLLNIVLKKSPILIFIVAVGADLFGYYTYEADALLYYSLGAFYAINKRYPFSLLPPQTSILFILIGVIMLSVNVHISNFSFSWLGVLSLTIGVWKFYDLIHKYIVSKYIIKYSKFCFIVYCAHIPFLTILKSVLFPHILGGALGCLLSFFISPIICAFLLICFAKTAQRIAPKTYAIFTGGR